VSRKILFINPISKEVASFSTDKGTRFPPIGLLMMAALTPPEWEVEFIDENFEPFIFREADLVALSAMTANINRAYEIASLYRKERIPVVLGGIHASMKSDEAHRYVDSVVVGEGEGVWQELVNDFKRGKLRKVYHGEKATLINLPIPRRDLLSPHYLMGSIQTARGCPFGCEFCSVTLFNGTSYRPRPIDEVVKELKTIKQKIVFFLDDNIIGPDEKARNRAGQLFDAIRHSMVNKFWLGQATIDFADHEDLMQKAFESGCRIIFIGFESVNEKSLKEMKKGINLRKGVNYYKECIKRFHDHGISVWGNFILGNDGDDYSTFRDTEEFVLNNGIDLVNFSCLTPLPGTELFERLNKEERIIHRNFPHDWNKYSFTDVVFKPKHFSPSELDRGITGMAKSTFSGLKAERTLCRSLVHNKSFTSSLMAYFMNRAFRRTAKMIIAQKENQWSLSRSEHSDVGIIL
jgi:radical SAM superfamily enzyme YgiQ (UPF0313 family)